VVWKEHPRLGRQPGNRQPARLGDRVNEAGIQPPRSGALPAPTVADGNREPEAHTLAADVIHHHAVGNDGLHEADLVPRHLRRTA
jgi:hypothetical protein